jgi:hypothetical protein
LAYVRFAVENIFFMLKFGENFATEKKEKKKKTLVLPRRGHYTVKTCVLRVMHS